MVAAKASPALALDSIPERVQPRTVSSVMEAVTNISLVVILPFSLQCHVLYGSGLFSTGDETSVSYNAHKKSVTNCNDKVVLVVYEVVK